jgi:curved DNA-binding protein CbpA
MGSPDSDPYATLGVVPSAIPDEIRAAYRRLAAACHPDLQPPEKKAWASEQMIQLNAARDLLLNTRRRVHYHQSLILFSLAGLVIPGLTVLLGLWKGLPAFILTQREV